MDILNSKLIPRKMRQLPFQCVGLDLVAWPSGQSIASLAEMPVFGPFPEVFFPSFFFVRTIQRFLSYESWRYYPGIRLVWLRENLGNKLSQDGRPLELNSRPPEIKANPLSLSDLRSVLWAIWPFSHLGFLTVSLGDLTVFTFRASGPFGEI